jgi:hypothetical protein
VRRHLTDGDIKSISLYTAQIRTGHKDFAEYLVRQRRNGNELVGDQVALRIYFCEGGIEVCDLTQEAFARSFLMSVDRFLSDNRTLRELLSAMAEMIFFCKE